MKYEVKLKEEYEINGIEIDINSEAFEDIGYTIREREEMINDLIMWISETKSNTDRELMKEDLKNLSKLNCEFVLSSLSTNEYLQIPSMEANKILKEILERCKK
jgi:hypothetical protein